MNTIASFNNIEKKELLDTCGCLILESIKNGDCLKNPSFLLLTYAHLKKYHFNYWFGFLDHCPSFIIVSVHALSFLPVPPPT
uniref:Ubiquitin-like modifier-activating enzyme Atg7 N-terminal domain-containing protein n=1 Tax=Amphimedon queenslandica TaxID=400682 RepID=A0A1X7TZR1_AMPQE